ncbi:MAG: hypothetical protein ACK42L_08200 [Thermoanaerobaculum sp.]
MPKGLLSLPALLTSWLLAACAWVLVWWVLPVIQGLGTAAAGGQFIGLSLPTWTQPWALVNEPSLGFAATRTALWAYWLSPFLAAFLLALVLPQLPCGTSLSVQLFLSHLALAAVCLGLAWLPSLGLEDGLLAALSRFFKQDPQLWRWGMALLAGILVRPVVLGLGSSLWHLPKGPTLGRRLLTWALHVGVPAGLWVAWVWASAPCFPVASLPPLLLVLLLSSVWALAAKPPHPLRQRKLYGASPWWALFFALLLVVPSLWVFSPAGLRPKGYLWGVERVTSNVRPETLKITLPLSPAARRGSSAPGS